MELKLLDNGQEGSVRCGLTATIGSDLGHKVLRLELSCLKLGLLKSLPPFLFYLLKKLDFFIFTSVDSREYGCSGLCQLRDFLLGAGFRLAKIRHGESMELRFGLFSLFV